MSIQDPISDMLTRIRNAQKPFVSMPYSKLKEAIAKVLKEQGFVKEVSSSGEGAKKLLVIDLKYFDGKPVIASIDRISKPSRRVYVGASDVPVILEGLGIAMISTSVGILTDAQARSKGLGGEVICTVT